MTIKITGCSDALFWYAKWIDHEFVVICQDLTEFLVRTPGGTTNIVKTIDCEIIKF